MKKKITIIASIWSSLLLIFILALSFILKPSTEYYFKALVFTIISYALSLVQIFRGIKREKKMQSYPFYIAGCIYFIGQMIFSIFSIIYSLSFTTFILVEDIMLLVYVLFGFIIFIFKEKKFFYDKYRKKQKTKVDSLINILVEINRMNITDEAKDEVLNLMDSLTRSEEVSHKEAKSLEDNIINQINALSILASSDKDDQLISKCKEINLMIEERNNLVKEKLLK